ncbi:MAG TPA: DUF3995 domain-containing protein [Cytophagales bacterium]|nr:DUF3995 domain-containing protein [Cytophagales bacterium]HAA18557.1 DUF3995 domain-containing protein [Cytophagales bacterium]HAP60235.1 DUF3995 domain-containing protein [Cytophagales bacterium]
MKSLLAYLLVAVFIALAALHFYWALGGNWGFESVLPTTAQGLRILAPTTVDSLVVGTLLFLCGAFYGVLAGTLKVNLPRRLQQVTQWGIPIIFILRAVGDFQYVGFFKQVTGTEFARLDTLFLSPLCLTIGVMGLWPGFLQRKS